MSHEKVKTNVYCVGGRHRFASISIDDELTKACQKVLFGKHDLYNGRNSVNFNVDRKKT